MYGRLQTRIHLLRPQYAAPVKRTPTVLVHIALHTMHEPDLISSDPWHPAANCAHERDNSSSGIENAVQQC